MIVGAVGDEDEATDRVGEGLAGEAVWGISLIKDITVEFVD